MKEDETHRDGRNVKLEERGKAVTPATFRFGNTEDKGRLQASFSRSVIWKDNLLDGAFRRGVLENQVTA